MSIYPDTSRSSEDIATSQGALPPDVEQVDSVLSGTGIPLAVNGTTPAKVVCTPAKGEYPACGTLLVATQIQTDVAPNVKGALASPLILDSIKGLEARPPLAPYDDGLETSVVNGGDREDDDEEDMSEAEWKPKAPIKRPTGTGVIKPKPITGPK